MNQAEEQTIKTTVKPFKNGKQTVEGDVISYIKKQRYAKQSCKTCKR